MTTAQIVEVNRNDDEISVTFVVDVDGKSNRFTISGVGIAQQDIKARIKQKISEYEKTLLLESTPIMGSVDLTPDPIPVKTQAQIDQEAWLALWYRWVRTRRLIDAQILTGAEPAVITLQNNVKAGFKQSYVDII